MTEHQKWLILRTRTLCFVLVCLLVSACSNRPPLSVNLNSQQHQAALVNLNHWQIRGKFGFKSPEKKQSASVSWEQHQDKFQLSLNSILGTSILSMQGNDTQVTIKADDETYHGSNASELIWQITGWTLPVEQLPIWIKGQSLPSDVVQLADQGWVTQLQPGCADCRGWLINYSDYALINNVWLPHKIVLLHQQDKIQVTIRVNSWTIN